MQRLVLDLRDNPGGPLDQAIAVSSRFLKRGQMVVYTRGRIPNSDEDYRADEQGGYTDMPLIVMVNRNSASASEIVSGAMQDHDRGARRRRDDVRQGARAVGLSDQQRRRAGADDGPLLHAERPADPAAVGRRVRRVPDLLASATRQPTRDHDAGRSEVHATAAARSTAAAASSRITSSPGRSRVQSVAVLAAARATAARSSASPSGSPRKATRGRRAQSAASTQVAPGWTVTDAMVDGVPASSSPRSACGSTRRRSRPTWRSSRR